MAAKAKFIKDCELALQEFVSISTNYGMKLTHFYMQYHKQTGRDFAKDFAPFCISEKQLFHQLFKNSDVRVVLRQGHDPHLEKYRIVQIGANGCAGTTSATYCGPNPMMGMPMMPMQMQGFPPPFPMPPQFHALPPPPGVLCKPEKSYARISTIVDIINKTVQQKDRTTQEELLEQVNDALELDNSQLLPVIWNDWPGFLLRHIEIGCIYANYIDGFLQYVQAEPHIEFSDSQSDDMFESYSHSTAQYPHPIINEVEELFEHVPSAQTKSFIVPSYSSSHSSQASDAPVPVAQKVGAEHLTSYNPIENSPTAAPRRITKYYPQQSENTTAESKSATKTVANKIILEPKEPPMAPMQPPLASLPENSNEPMVASALPVMSSEVIFDPTVPPPSSPLPLPRTPSKNVSVAPEDSPPDTPVKVVKSEKPEDSPPGTPIKNVKSTSEIEGTEGQPEQPIERDSVSSESVSGSPESVIMLRDDTKDLDLDIESVNVSPESAKMLRHDMKDLDLDIESDQCSLDSMLHVHTDNPLEVEEIPETAKEDDERSSSAMSTSSSSDEDVSESENQKEPAKQHTVDEHHDTYTYTSAETIRVDALYAEEASESAQPEVAPSGESNDRAANNYVTSESDTLQYVSPQDVILISNENSQAAAPAQTQTLSTTRQEDCALPSSMGNSAPPPRFGSTTTFRGKPQSSDSASAEKKQTQHQPNGVAQRQEIPLSILSNRRVPTVFDRGGSRSQSMTAQELNKIVLRSPEVTQQTSSPIVGNNQYITVEDLTRVILGPQPMARPVTPAESAVLLCKSVTPPALIPPPPLPTSPPSPPSPVRYPPDQKSEWLSAKMAVMERWGDQIPCLEDLVYAIMEVYKICKRIPKDKVNDVFDAFVYNLTGDRTQTFNWEPYDLDGQKIWLQELLVHCGTNDEDSQYLRPNDLILKCNIVSLPAGVPSELYNMLRRIDDEKCSLHIVVRSMEVRASEDSTGLWNPISNDCESIEKNRAQRFDILNDVVSEYWKIFGKDADEIWIQPNLPYFVVALV